MNDFFFQARSALIYVSDYLLFLSRTYVFNILHTEILHS